MDIEEGIKLSFWEEDVFNFNPREIGFRRAKQVDRISQHLCFKNTERKDMTHYQDLIEKMVKIEEGM